MKYATSTCGTGAEDTTTASLVDGANTAATDLDTCKAACDLL
jgi:hypothetical protein